MEHCKGLDIVSSLISCFFLIIYYHLPSVIQTRKWLKKWEETIWNYF